MAGTGMRGKATRVMDDPAAGAVARAQKATKVSDAAAVDVLLGAADGATGFRRLDVAMSRATDGSLRVQV